MFPISKQYSREANYTLFALHHKQNSPSTHDMHVACYIGQGADNVMNIQNRL